MTVDHREINKNEINSKPVAQFQTQHLSLMEPDTPPMDKPEQNLQLLRDILLGDYQARLDALEAKLEETSTKLQQTESKLEATETKLVETTTELDQLRIDANTQDQSLLSEIRQIHASQIYKEQILDEVEPQIPRLVQASITDSQDEMIDALYPIMGKLVTRSVTQSMRDLARNIDAQMRKTFSFSSFTRSMKARATGVSEAEMALRDSLPFGGVDEILLIHQNTGILLQSLSREIDPKSGEVIFLTRSEDSDLISAMLTAVQDFVADAFGDEGEPGSLGGFQQGQKQVMIKAGRLTYMAVVIEGIAPSDFGSKIQDHVYEIESEYVHVLRDFNGNVSALDGAQTHLKEIIVS